MRLRRLEAELWHSRTRSRLPSDDNRDYRAVDSSREDVARRALHVLSDSNLMYACTELDHLRIIVGCRFGSVGSRLSTNGISIRDEDGFISISSIGYEKREREKKKGTTWEVESVVYSYKSNFWKERFVCLFVFVRWASERNSDEIVRQRRARPSDAEEFPEYFTHLVFLRELSYSTWLTSFQFSPGLVYFSVEPVLWLIYRRAGSTWISIRTISYPEYPMCNPYYDS